jgi:hypothetical protein
MPTCLRAGTRRQARRHYIWKVTCHSREGGNPVLSSSSLFLDVFSDVDLWYSYLLKIVTKLKIIEQGKFARKHPQYRYIKANWPVNQWL